MGAWLTTPRSPPEGTMILISARAALRLAVGASLVALLAGPSTATSLPDRFAAPYRVVNGTTGPLSVADVTGDGLADVVTGTTVFVSRGDGSFDHAINYATRETSSRPCVADLDHDGLMDIIHTNKG